ncbi:hypothetical protein D9M70_523510 [compost metagenome]
MQVAHGSRLDAETDDRAFRNDGLVGAVRHALGALGLIKQVGELCAGTLVAGRVDVRDVVRDHFEVQLLGVHAGCGNGKGLHVSFLQICMRAISR